MKVIDVSKHNGAIDWIKVRSSGIEGVIIRTGFGRLVSQKDIMFEANYRGAMEAGLHIGAYWYSYAVTVSEAVQEAKAFLECIGDKKFDLPLYLDIEEETQVKLGKKVCTDIANAFCQTMEKAGYFIGVYSFDSFFGTNLDKDIPNRYSCWVARVDGKSPQSCRSYDMWQYSWKGRINGVNGDVDMNDCYKDLSAVIKKSGLNGYDKTDTYNVTAKIRGVTPEKAVMIFSACTEMGMTVTQEKE